jgi:hypothetical protein
MLSITQLSGLALLCLAGLGACSSNDPTTSSSTTSSTTTGSGGGGGAGGSGGSGGSGPVARCTQPMTVACSDQVILDMNLKKDVTPGKVGNMADGSGWISTVDATAGGAFASDPTSYTYAKFGADGLTKVALGDEAALDSMDWDIAFRRYVVRINSGNSGPSCVQAAHLPGKPKFEDVTTVDAGALFRSDEYFTQSCDLIPDGSGLMGSPATALSSYWTYPGCVQMTDNVFIVALADGQNLKLQVSDYYTPAVQDQCDTKGSVPMSNTGSANFIVRWAFLP